MCLNCSDSSEPSGIFVKSITKDSTVDQDGRIHIGDQIIAVSTLIMLFWLRLASVFSRTRSNMQQMFHIIIDCDQIYTFRQWREIMRCMNLNNSQLCFLFALLATLNIKEF